MVQFLVRKMISETYLATLPLSFYQRIVTEEFLTLQIVSRYLLQFQS